MEIIFLEFNLKDAWDVLFLLERINRGLWNVFSRSDVGGNSKNHTKMKNIEFEDYYQNFLERLATQPPKILYKYRNWNNEFHRRLITHRELYFAKPGTLNDLWDGTGVDDYGLLDYDRCIYLNKQMIPASQYNLTQEEVEQWAKRMVEDKVGYHPEMRERHKEKDFEIIEDLGIVSLSAEPDNQVLWSHYAYSHQGFVVGMDSIQLSCYYGSIRLEKVRYVEEYPTIHIGDMLNNQLRYSTKLIDWAYEREWRLIADKMRFNKIIKNRTLCLAQDTIKEVIIVAKTDKQIEKEIIKICRQELPNVQIKKAIASYKGSKALDLMIIE